MYDHLVRGLSDIARSLKISRIRRLTPKEIELIEESSRKFGATLRSLENSRQANAFLEKQIERLKEVIDPITLNLLEKAGAN